MVSAEYVNWVRRAEVEVVAPLLRPGASVLEIGGGTGQQALDFSSLGFEVTSIDLPASTYSAARIFPIIEYDGRTIPFGDGSFDIVFSSNTLEHVRDLEPLHAEIRRVLKPDGYCVHVLPTANWRFWTMISGLPSGARQLVRSRSAADLKRALGACIEALLPARHGERGNALLELWLFRPAWWRRHFARNGFTVTVDRPVGFLYTGHELFGTSWPADLRRRLARVLGSSTHIFVLQPQHRAQTTASRPQPVRSRAQP